MAILKDEQSCSCVLGLTDDANKAKTRTLTRVNPDVTDETMHDVAAKYGALLAYTHGYTQRVDKCKLVEME